MAALFAHRNSAFPDPGGSAARRAACGSDDVSFLAPHGKPADLAGSAR
jgi:hypothetical protein